MDSYARIDISNSIIRIKYILLEDTFRWHSHHTKPTDINDMSCCRSWSCTNQLSAISSHSCCFPSFWLWSIVHVNIHSFLSCSINMRCVLIGEIPHTFHKSHWLFLMPGSSSFSQHYCSDTVILVGCYCDFYVLPMKRPTLWIFNLCFCCSVTNLSVGYPRVLLNTHVQSSVVGLFFVAVPLPRLPGIDTKWHQVIIPNLDYLKPSGDKNWRLLQKLLIDLRDLDCVWICASCLWSFRNLSLWMFLLCYCYLIWVMGRGVSKTCL